MARDPALLQAEVSAALADLRRRSATLASKLEATKSGNSLDATAQSWDVVVIGGGIHDQILQNVLAKDGSRLRVLTIERTDRIASNFALAGQSGRVNSTTRPSDARVQPRPGTGN